MFRLNALLFALVLSSVVLPRVEADIVISEIHYAPAGGNSDLEFIELANDGPEAYDLSGFGFSRGVNYIFPEGTFIPGRGFLVVCRDSAAVRAEYGISNAVGNFDGVLDNAGETVELANPQGLPVSTVSYNDRGQWPSAPKGTGHSLSVKSIYKDVSDADSWTVSTTFGGSPGRRNFNTEVSFIDTILLDDDEVWRYFKGQSAPPGNWNDPGFNDGGWLAGRTGIGYGDGDDRTELTDMEDNYVTIFCRKTFTIDDLDDVDSLVLRLTIDDGFYAYLNGTEVGSANVDGRDFDDTAAGAGEPEGYDVGLAKNLLVEGENVLAVQVHNGSIGSSDLSFIPSLVSRRVLQPESGINIPVEVNEGHLFTTGERFIELYNDGDSEVDLSGFWMTDEFADLQKFEIPADTRIPGRGFLVFTEAELGLDLEVEPGVRDSVEIALTNAAGDYVVDARVFAPAVEDKSESRFPDGDESFAGVAEPTPGAPNEVDVVRDIIFNELNYHPFSNRDADEWVEFYNRGEVAHDISGWQIEGLNYVFAPGTVMQPGQYVVVARSPVTIRRRYDLDDTVVLDPAAGGRLADSGERLRLLDLDGKIAAQIRYYDGGEWAQWADGYGSTLERIDPFGEESASTTWDASDDSGESEVQDFTYTGNNAGESEFQLMLMTEGICLVDDLRLTRSGSNTNLISNGSFDSNTSSWRIEGTHIRSGRTTNADERITGNGSLKMISWNGGGDYKVNKLETDTGSQGSSMTASFKARWIIGSPSLLTAGSYVPGGGAGIARSHTLRVPSTLGTPGEINSVTLRQIDRHGSENVGPEISRVRHSPGVPEAGEDVSVRARVRDIDGVVRVRLFVRENNPNGSFAASTMAGPDSEGFYTDTVSGRGSGTKILFYIEAEDEDGAVTRYPRDIMEGTHPPVVNPSSAAGDEKLYCLYRHDQRVPDTSFHSYRFVLDDSRVSELGSRRLLSNFQLPGTFIFGSGDVYYNSKVRFAGSPWQRSNGGTYEKSYTIRMPKDNLLHGRRRAFNLDEHGRNGRERIAHYLLRRNAGPSRLPYTDTHALVRWQLNDVETGTYEDLLKPNSQYMDFWFQDSGDGAFFEMDDRFSFNDGGSRTGSQEGKVLAPPYGSGSSDKENYRWYFAVRNRKGFDDFTPMMALAQFMDSRSTRTAAFDQGVFSTWDVEEVLRTWAIRMNIDDWDTWCGRRGKNCYFYQSALDAKWRLVPWDLELTFGNGSAFSMPGSYTTTFTNHFSEITRMINRPKIKRMYYGILKEQVDSFFFTGGGSPLSAYASQLSGSGVDLGGTLGYVNSRANLIRSWIRSATSPAVDLEITTNGGDDFLHDELTVELAGRAPAEIATFAVVRNDEFLENSPEFEIGTNMLVWSTEIPLLAGSNQLDIVGFNSVGDLVDSTSITISNTPAWGPPVITELAPAQAAIGSEIAIVGEEFHDGLVVRFADNVIEDVIFDEATDPTTIRVIVPPEVLGNLTTVEVENVDGQRSDPALLTIVEDAEQFIRSDANVDGSVDISDAVATLTYLFLGGEGECLDAMDTNDNGVIDLTDAVVTLAYLFQGGAAPAAPHPSAGVDDTADDLDCAKGL